MCCHTDSRATKGSRKRKFAAAESILSSSLVAAAAAAAAAVELHTTIEFIASQLVGHLSSQLMTQFSCLHIYTHTHNIVGGINKLNGYKSNNNNDNSNKVN